MSDRGQTQAAVVSERKNKKYSHFLCRHLCIQLDINSDEQSESDDSLLRFSLEESLMRPTGDYISFAFVSFPWHLYKRTENYFIQAVVLVLKGQ